MRTTAGRFPEPRGRAVLVEEGNGDRDFGILDAKVITSQTEATFNATSLLPLGEGASDGVQALRPTAGIDGVGGHTVAMAGKVRSQPSRAGGGQAQSIGRDQSREDLALLVSQFPGRSLFSAELPGGELKMSHLGSAGPKEGMAGGPDELTVVCDVPFIQWDRHGHAESWEDQTNALGENGR